VTALFTIQRFEIVARLGEGGMGVVYRARDPRLNRDVAIKLLSAGAIQPRTDLDTRDTVDLRGAAPSGDLLAEARAMAALSHPNVLPIYEVGLDGTAPFLVMEYVVGGSLRAFLAEPHDVAAIAAMFAQAARGLAAAHGVGIVHRDFKPDNVLIGADGRARVADFGLANVVAAPRALERLAEVAGTPRFMAPELLDGAPADARSDCFALCRSLDDALAARRDVPRQLRAVIATGLAADPALRPDIATVLAALEAVPRRRRRGAVAIAAVGLASVAVAGLVAAVLPGGAEVTCADRAAALLPGRWDATTRALLRAQLPADRAAVVLDAVDARARTFTTAHAAACEAAKTGELSPVDADHRAACLERRAIELSVDLRRVVAHPGWSVERAQAVALQGLHAESCDGLVEGPPRDVDAATSLLRRLIDSDDLPTSAQIDTLAAIVRDADAAGEVGTATRAGIALANWLRAADRLAEADAAADRAYEGATAISSTQSTARALLERGDIALARDDEAAARSYAQLAATLVDKPTVAPRVRGMVYAQLAEAAEQRRDWRDELDNAARGTRSLEGVADADPLLVSSLSAKRVEATIGLGSEEAVQVARDHLMRATKLLAADAPDVGVAHGLLAQALDHTAAAAGYSDRTEADELAVRSARAEAVVERRVEIDILTRELGSASSYTLDAQVDLAGELERVGQRGDALTELDDVVAKARGDALTKVRGYALAASGAMRFRAGDGEAAVETVAQGLDELIARLGADHPDVLALRRRVAVLDLELGRVDDAARELTTLAAASRRRPGRDGGTAWPLAMTAQVALARGDAATAERSASEALAVLERATAAHARPVAGDDSRALALDALARARFARKDLPGAVEAVAEARLAALAAGVEDGARAEIDVTAAQIYAAEGNREDAVTTATAALKLLGADRGHPRAAARAQTLLQQLGR
jgi:hypothetical protein